MSNQSLGLMVILIGVVTIVVGLVIWAGGLAWLGKLPGDIRIEGKNATIFVPLMSMCLLSIVLSLVLSLIARFLK